MYLLFDIGGTSARIALSKDKKNIGEAKILDTPKDFNEAIRLFEKVVPEITVKKKIEAAVAGVPGPLDQEKTQILNAPNLSGWNQKPLKKEFEKLFQAPAYLENDAALGALGEATVGAGKGKSIVAYLTIGTGVGGARIVNGKIDANALGFEPGHQFICFEANRDLESYIGGLVLEKLYKKRPSEIMESKAWEEVARLLAYGLANTIVHWSPDIVVLGGSIINKIPIERVRYHLKNILKIFPEPPAIEKAKLGDLSGLYGGLALINNLKPNT